MDYQERLICKYGGKALVHDSDEPYEWDDYELWEDDDTELPCGDTNKPGTECCESCEYQDECMEQLEDL